MRYIKLTKGKYAIVDDTDFNWLNQWKWCVNNTGYAFRFQYLGQGRRMVLLMHRMIMDTPKGMETDHINGNGFDNQRKNLRMCVREENMRNQKKQSRHTSSVFKGVCWDKKAKRWLASIYHKRQISIGLFTNEVHAAMAYDIWAKDLFGEFARLNFQEQI
ncbi:MAG: hypothetical protein ACREBU_23195 [Nitrososphaera sp.]